MMEVIAFQKTNYLDATYLSHYLLVMAFAIGKSQDIIAKNVVGTMEIVSLMGTQTAMFLLVRIQ